MKAFLYWAPRILLILFIGFFLLMGLDVFSMPGTLLEKCVGYLMHSLPALFLLIPLVLSKKKVISAGVFCIVLALFGFFFFHTYRNLVVYLLVTVLPLVAGFMFLYESKRSS